MKHSKTVIVLTLLLVLLLFGGGILYRQLTAPDTVPEAGALAVRHTAAPAAATPAPPREETDAQASTPAVTLAAETAPDFTVLDEQGSEVSLSDYFGKPIVVNFWASWCPPCRAELPDFDRAAAAYGDRVQFMMINVTDGRSETVESATAFARDENGYGFPLFFDTEAEGALAYQINAIPVTLFIRADGSLLYRQIGLIDGAALEDYISQLLA